MHVVIGGPPHSGKSTFTAALIEHIRERQRKQTFSISFEWMTLDITDNSLAYLLDDTGSEPRKLDTEWTDDNAEKRASEFASKSCQLVIADAPGQLTEQLNIVVDPADAMVLLVSDEKSEQMVEWREQAQQLGISIHGEITSFLDEDSDIQISKGDGNKILGSIKSVSRDDFDAEGTHAYDDDSRNVIRYIASCLIKEAREN